MLVCSSILSIGTFAASPESGTSFCCSTLC
jgi:hypothetical protein